MRIDVQSNSRDVPSNEYLIQQALDDLINSGISISLSRCRWNLVEAELVALKASPDLAAAR